MSKPEEQPDVPSTVTNAESSSIPAWPLLESFSTVSKTISENMGLSAHVGSMGFPNIVVGSFAEQAIKDVSKLTGVTKMEMPLDLKFDPKETGKLVDGIMEPLKALGLDKNLANTIGSLFKKGLEIAKEVKSVGFSVGEDGKPRVSIDFKSPQKWGPVTVGEKGPLEFSISPNADKSGVNFSDIKGARVGLGLLKTDVKDASLSLKDGNPKLTLNKTIPIPLGFLTKLID
jgi:hypothetical protein